MTPLPIFPIPFTARIWGNGELKAPPEILGVRECPGLQRKEETVRNEGGKRCQSDLQNTCVLQNSAGGGQSLRQRYNRSSNKNEGASLGLIKVTQITQYKLNTLCV